MKILNIPVGVIIVTLVLLLISGSVFTVMYKNIRDLKNDRDRLQHNMSGDDIDTSRSKSGLLVNTSAGDVLTVSEFKEYQDKLKVRLDDIGVKVKNISSVSNITYHQYYKIDSTFKTSRVSDSTFKFSYSDKYLDIKQGLRITPDSGIMVDTPVVNVRGGMMLTHEVIYKRNWLFWRKAVGVKLHVVSNNPHIALDSMQLIELKKKY
jgi:hypothetical protein